MRLAAGLKASGAAVGMEVSVARRWRRNTPHTVPEEYTTPDLTPDPPDLPAKAEQPDLSASRFVEVRLMGVSLAGETRLGLSLTDCALRDCDLANLDARGGALRRVEIVGGRLTGCNLSEGSLLDVRIEDCRADLTAFALTKLERARFASCSLVQADFQQARLRAVVFEGM